MTSLVPSHEIEELVGASRHDLLHLGRWDTSDDQVYILHSKACASSSEDLRDCVFSRLLDEGLDDHYWGEWGDTTVVLGRGKDECLVPVRAFNE